MEPRPQSSVLTLVEREVSQHEISRKTGVDRRQSRLLERRFQLSGLNERASLAEFDWGYNPKIPKREAQDNYTDPESRIMKRAGGGFDYSYNAHATVDDTAHIIVADAGFRSEAVFEQFKDSPTEVIVALGREGTHKLVIDATTHPHTAAMAKKFKSSETQTAYRRRKWLSEPPNGWVKNVLGFRQFIQYARDSLPGFSATMGA